MATKVMHDRPVFPTTRLLARVPYLVTDRPLHSFIISRGQTLVGPARLKRAEAVRLSLGRAQRFIEDGVNPEGFWSDFMTLAGESVDWVTGYVGYALAEGLTARGGEDAPWPSLREMGARLLERQHRDGGWGYGSIVPSDADSTSWCLLFLAEVQALDPPRLERALSFLSRHQSPLDGGFRTYSVPSEIGRFMRLEDGVSFDGWASSTPCITAAVAHAVLKTTGSLSRVHEALDYVRATQTTQGYWNSYWWTDPLYSTVLCMRALDAAARLPPGDRVPETTAERAAERDGGALERASAWISSTQRADGAWGAEDGGWPFSTALALSGLAMRYPRDETIDGDAAVQRGVDWLLATQLQDGSWEGRHILRIPHPSMKEPWTQTGWKVDGKAINAVIRDHRRFYTTATVVRALSEFEEKSSMSAREGSGDGGP
jgi:hypothetical protein